MGTVMKKNFLLRIVVIALLIVAATTVQGCWLNDPDIPASTITRIYVGCSAYSEDVISQELVIHDDGSATLTVTSAAEVDGETVTQEYEIEKEQLSELFEVIDSRDLMDNAMLPFKSDEELDEAFMPILIECGDKTYVPPTTYETSYPDRVAFDDVVTLVSGLGGGDVE